MAMTRAERRNRAFRSKDVKGTKKVWRGAPFVYLPEYGGRSRYMPHQGKREKARRARQQDEASAYGRVA